MDTFLEFLREALKGIVREIGAYLFRRSVLDKNKKTTLRRPKQKGGSRKNK